MLALSCLAWVQIPTQLQTVMPVFHTQGDSSMCVPSLGWTFNWCPGCRHWLVDAKDPTVYFAKNRRAIAGTRLNKLQIPALIT